MPDRALIRTTVAAFVVSRALFFAIVLIGSQTAFLGKTYSNSVWETRTRLSWQRVLPELQRMVMIGDAWWYERIATRGYDPAQHGPANANWGFFPLFPLIARFAGPTGNFAVDGMLVSNLSAFASLLLLGAVGQKAGFGVDASQRAIWYLAFYPSSYFLGLPVTEGLFLLLSVACVYGMLSDRWWLAGIAGALASATRIGGILLLVPAAAAIAVTRPRSWRRVAWTALIPLGLIAFFLYLRFRTNDIFAYVHAQGTWGHSATWPWQPLIAQIADPLAVSDPWNLRWLNFAAVLLLIIASVALLLQRHIALGVYGLASAALPLCTGSLTSASRYVAVAFPLFLWLGLLGRRAWFDRVWFAISAALLGCLAALFTLRIDFALA